MPVQPNNGGSPACEAAAAGPVLEEPIREHLGRQLRTTYAAMADKPAFLGDPAVPSRFEDHVQRLEAMERERHQKEVHQHGLDAVAKVLGDLRSKP
ncbi:MAG TPA: hypothetical protein VG758_27000 [Hyphomicrobiaceae bacterium]|jgi:hypothetical protein|nr:hypothetical protein [Hyphomicrobiaceae bacterium]